MRNNSSLIGLNFVWLVGSLLITTLLGGCKSSSSSRHIYTTTSEQEFETLVETKNSGNIVLTTVSGEPIKEVIKTQNNTYIIQYANQTDQSHIDAIGIRNKSGYSSTIELYENGVVKSYYQYNNEKENEDCIRFRSSGKISEINRYKSINNGSFLNECYIFYADGKLSKSSQFVWSELIKFKGNDQLFLEIRPMGKVFEKSTYRLLIPSKESGFDTVSIRDGLLYLPVKQGDSTVSAILEEYELRADTLFEGRKQDIWAIKKTYIDYIIK